MELQNFEFKFLGDVKKGGMPKGVPVTPAGVNQRLPEEIEKDEVPQNRVDCISRLRESPFQIIHHTRPMGEHLKSFSFGVMRSRNNETAVFQLVTDDGKDYEHYAVPYDDIIGLLPIPSADLTAIWPWPDKEVVVGNEVKIVKITPVEYFCKFARDFVLQQGISQLWKLNNGGPDA